MAFRNNTFATVWSVEPGKKFDGSAANFSNVRLTISHKKPNTNPAEYETDFSGFVRFVGDAHKMAAGLKEKDRIQLNEVAVTGGVWNQKTKKATSYSFSCFSFTPADAVTQNATQTRQVYRPEVNPGADEELPFN